MTSSKHLKLLKSWVERQQEVLKDIDKQGFRETIGSGETQKDWFRCELEYLFGLINGKYIEEIGGME